MSKSNLVCEIPSAASVIILTLGKSKHSDISRLTAEEADVMENARVAMIARHKAQGHDGTGAVRPEVFDSGRKLVDNEEIWGGPLPATIEALGYQLADVYEDLDKPRVVAKFSKHGLIPTYRVNDKSRAALTSLVNRNRYLHLYDNTNTGEPTVTINLVGSYQGHLTRELTLVGQESTAPSEA